MNKKLYWSNGLKIDSTLQLNLKDCITRVKSKKASMIVIDGGVGEGKTTLGVECGQSLAKELGEDFTILEQVKQSGSDFLKGMDWAVQNKRHIVIYDEAGDFNTRASLTYFNQSMNRVFETYRALGIIVIMCLPSFSDLDTSLMKKKITRMLIHCYGRTATYGKYSVYSLWRMWYLKQGFAKVTVPDDAFKFTAPNFRGHFRDLDVEDSKELEKHSIKGKQDIIRKSMLREQGLIPIKEIAQKTGYSIDTIRKYIKKSKPKGEKYGATLYYHKEIVDNIILTKERNESITT